MFVLTHPCEIKCTKFSIYVHTIIVCFRNCQSVGEHKFALSIRGIDVKPQV